MSQPIEIVSAEVTRARLNLYTAARALTTAILEPRPYNAPIPELAQIVRDADDAFTEASSRHATAVTEAIRNLLAEIAPNEVTA